ncbi:hypothetical protein [Streptomyces sp. URMC 125]|uniref:hypothetical protein n=1 Tax=Streptomyces sp. URMC 125 TaxID=3423419 RepID=UPI003F1B3729
MCEEPDPEHVHGPASPLCDELLCQRCMHDCDCDVCLGKITAPGLTILEDSHEFGGTAKMPEVVSMEEVPVASLIRGDYVEATGRDVRGHTVTRKGRVLRKPEHVHAQRDGKRVKAIRIHVGELGEAVTRSNSLSFLADETVKRGLEIDPEDQEDEKVSRWDEYPALTQGESVAPVKVPKVEPEPEPDEPEKDEIGTLTATGFLSAIRGRSLPEEGDQGDELKPEAPAREWERRRMADLVDWSDRRRFFYYGGPAKGPANESGPLVSVKWSESKNGRNNLVDAETGAVVDVVHSMTYIWAAPAEEPEGYTEPEHDEHQDQTEEDEPEPDPRPAARPRRGVLYEGWVGDLIPGRGFEVWSVDRRHLIGYLSPDHTEFVPV